MRFATSRMARRSRTIRPMSLWTTTGVACGSASRDVRRLCFRCCSRVEARQPREPAAAPCAAARHGPKGHATTAHRELDLSLPEHRRVALERRHCSFGGACELGCLSGVDRARAHGPSFQPPSGRFPVAPSCVAHVAANGGRAPNGHQETGQWPTRCSSTRPIRRRPGWSFCAATVSRNSTSSQPTANSFAAISISPR